MTEAPRIEEIKALISELRLEELITLMSEIEERLETMIMMQLAETRFQEWKNPEEDIYINDK
ncbi:hypothetical protein NIES25_37140 [Nostoc linckia NIES-25]|nr:hypothetical protein NIES25_37140 [Nostoc linckia NIES-25]